MMPPWRRSAAHLSAILFPTTLRRLYIAATTIRPATGDGD
jgi:hypothetical protein